MFWSGLWLGMLIESVGQGGSWQLDLDGVSLKQAQWTPQPKFPLLEFVLLLSSVCWKWAEPKHVGHYSGKVPGVSVTLLGD